MERVFLLSGDDDDREGNANVVGFVDVHWNGCRGQREIPMNELQNAIERLKSGRSVGIDGVRAGKKG